MLSATLHFLEVGIDINGDWLSHLTTIMSQCSKYDPHHKKHLIFIPGGGDSQQNIVMCH